MTFEIGETEDQRRERLSKAVAFAGRYVRSFDRELLNHWQQQIVERTLPPNASHAEHAYHEGQRAFVVGIIRQYQFALTGSFDTPWQPIPQSSPPPRQPPRRPRQQRTRKPRRQRNRPPSGSSPTA